MADLDGAPPPQEPCHAALEAVGVNRKRSRIDRSGRSAADDPKSLLLLAAEYSRDGAQSTNLVGSARASAGQDDSDFVIGVRHGGSASAQGAIENQQHRRRRAPDVAIAEGNSVVIAARIADHAEMALLVGGLE